MQTKGLGWVVNVTAVVAVAVLVGAGLVARQGVGILREADHWVDHTREVDLALERLLGDIGEAESATRAFIVRAEQAYLDAFTATLPRIRGDLNEVASLTSDNPTQSARIPPLRATIDRRLDLLQKGIARRQQSADLSEVIPATPEGPRLMQQIREQIRLMQATEADLLIERKARLADAQTLDQYAALAVSLLAGALIVILLAVARRQARRLLISEGRLATTIASIGDAVLTTDASGRVERLNPVAERLTGWSAQDAVGRPLLEVFVIVNEETRAVAENPVERVFREGGTVGLANHTVLIARDGGEVAIEDSAAPIGDHAHGRDGVVLVFRDATHSRALEKARLASERRFRQIADGMPQIVYVLDESGAVEFVNRRLQDYTGQKHAGPFDGAGSAVHPDDHSRLALEWAQARAARVPLEAPYRLRGRDGEWRWFLTRVVPGEDESGHRCWYGTSTDIDAQIRAQEALALADRRKDEFVATLAHELRNPLAPMRNAAHILKVSGADSSARTWAAEVIDRQVRTMASLLENLLDVARMTRGALELHKSQASLKAIVEAAVETVQPLIESREHSLRVSLPDTDVVFEADPLRLTQVLANILANAAKFTDAGGRIEARAQVAGDKLILTVRDNGIGLEPDAASYIFDTFTQVPGTKERAAGGLGIGLAIVKGLVELHGGTVTAASAGRGKGSEFRVVVPKGSATGALTSGASAATPVAGRKGLHVLVADDGADSAQSLAKVLELNGYQVTAALDGASALAAAESSRPDAAVLDIGMPGQNGYEVAQALRARSWARDLVLIAVTGWGQENDRSRALAAGFDDHLVKPVEPGTLLDALARVSERRRPDPSDAS